MFNKNWWFLNFQKEFLNFSFCIRKLAVAFYMINEIQPKIKFQNIVQCPFKFGDILNWLNSGLLFECICVHSCQENLTNSCTGGVSNHKHTWLGIISFLISLQKRKHVFLYNMESISDNDSSPVESLTADSYLHASVNLQTPFF